MRSTDIFNLDFTSVESVEGADPTELVGEAGSHAAGAIRCLEEALSQGSRDGAAWRLLGSLYMGTGNINALNELEARHERNFGTPMFLVTQQPKPDIESSRKRFEMPARIIAGSLPEPGEVLAACAASAGAALDFSRVRGADPGGLRALAALLSQLPRDETRPELPGIERFMESLEHAADSPAGNREMWTVLFDYLRFTHDEAAFDELSIRFAVRFGVSPPSF